MSGCEACGKGLHCGLCSCCPNSPQEDEDETPTRPLPKEPE